MYEALPAVGARASESRGSLPCVTVPAVLPKVALTVGDVVPATEMPAPALTAETLALNAAQSVCDRDPLDVALAALIERFGVAPPELVSGAVAVTPVTPPPLPPTPHT